MLENLCTVVCVCMFLNISMYLLSFSPVEACHLEKEVGPCRAQLPVWYYDAVEHLCKEFKYGGCQGNANRFGTKEQCHLTCHPQGMHLL